MISTGTFLLAKDELHNNPGGIVLVHKEIPTIPQGFFPKGENTTYSTCLS